MSTNRLNFKLNTISEGLYFVIATVVAFIITPYLINQVGKDLYGLFSLIGSVLVYIQLLDAGLSAGLLKYLSGFYARQEWSDFKKYINNSIILYLLAGIMVFFLGLVFAFNYQYIFNVNPELLVIGRWLFIIESLQLSFVMITTPFRVTILSFQKLAFVKIILIIAEISKIPLMFLFFMFFNYQKAFLFYNIALNCLMFFLTVIVLKCFFKHYYPQYHFSIKTLWTDFNKKIVFSLLGFSVWIFIGQICSILIDKTDTTVIGIFLNLQAVTYYALASNIVWKSRGFMNILMVPISLLISNVVGSGDIDKEELVLYQGSRIFLAITSAFFVLLFIFFEKFIVFWVGTDFMMSVAIGRILIIYLFFVAVFMIPSFFLFYKGLIKAITFNNILAAVLNLSLSIVLVKKMGLLGVAYGTLIPYLFVNIPIFLLIMKNTGLGLGRFLWQVLCPLAPLMLFYVFVAQYSLWFLDKFIKIVDNLWYLLFYMGLLYLLMMVIYFFLFAGKKDRAMIFSMVKLKK